MHSKLCTPASFLGGGGILRVKGNVAPGGELCFISANSGYTLQKVTLGVSGRASETSSNVMLDNVSLRLNIIMSLFSPLVVEKTHLFFNLLAGIGLGKLVDIFGQNTPVYNQSALCCVAWPPYGQIYSPAQVFSGVTRAPLAVCRSCDMATGTSGYLLQPSCPRTMFVGHPCPVQLLHRFGRLFECRKQTIDYTFVVGILQPSVVQYAW